MMIEFTFNSRAIANLDRMNLSNIGIMSMDNNLEIRITGRLFFHNDEIAGYFGRW